MRLACLLNSAYTINLKTFTSALPLGIKLCKFFSLLTCLATQGNYSEIIIPTELSDQYISRLVCLGSKISKLKGHFMKNRSFRLVQLLNLQAKPSEGAIFLMSFPILEQSLLKYVVQRALFIRNEVKLLNSTISWKIKLLIAEITNHLVSY